jgi:hypothetical protein
MNLKTLLERKQPSGNYVAVSFDTKTMNAIKAFMDKNDIPNQVSSAKLHTTVIYSKKYDSSVKGKGEIGPPWKGEPKHLEVWESKDKDTKCLVLVYQCKQLENRHKYLMSHHDLTYDFDEYIPHITLSYDVGDITPQDLPSPKTIGTISIVKEYAEELKEDWASTSTK